MINATNNAPSFKGYYKIKNAPLEAFAMLAPQKGVVKAGGKKINGVTEFVYKTSHKVDEKTFDEGVLETLKSFITGMNKMISDAKGKQKPIELFYSLTDSNNLDKLI